MGTLKSISSPDGQNGELYYALREKGLLNAGYSAPYHWKLRERNTGWFLTYTEGDIDIYQVEINCPVCRKPFKNNTCVECDKLVAKL